MSAVTAPLLGCRHSDGEQVTAPAQRGASPKNPDQRAQIAVTDANVVPAAARGHTRRRIDYALVLSEQARLPVLDSGLLFAEPLVLADKCRMYLSDHVAPTVRLGLGCVPTERA
jgi:hypothetical protein